LTIALVELCLRCLDFQSMILMARRSLSIKSRLAHSN
jgi:hypothetical protein